MNRVSKGFAAACVGAAVLLSAVGAADAHGGGGGGHGGGGFGGHGGFGGFGGHMGGFGGHMASAGNFHGFGGHDGHGGHHFHHFRGPFAFGLGGYDDDYYDYGDVGSCSYYRVRASQTGRSYWWARYRDCVSG